MNELGNKGGEQMQDMKLKGADHVPVCPKCGWSGFRKSGMRFLSGQKVQQFQCKHCGHLIRGKSASSPNFPDYDSM